MSIFFDIFFSFQESIVVVRNLLYNKREESFLFAETKKDREGVDTKECEGENEKGFLDCRNYYYCNYFRDFCDYRP